MTDSDFDRIVGDFYRAATGATTWDAALDRVQSAFGARAALLHSADMRTGRMLALHTGGPARSDASLDYVRHYHHIDPRRAHILSSLPGIVNRWWHCHEHLDQRALEDSSFSREFLSAYDTRYLSAVLIEPRAGVFTAFALELPAARGVLTPDEREVARRLGDHLREALQAHQRTLALVSQALAGHKLLDAFPYPMWLIGEDRQVDFSNPAARREEEGPGRVVRHGANLALAEGRADQRLSVSLHELCRRPHGDSLVVDLRTTAADAPTWLHLALLRPEAVMGAFGERPEVLATLFDPQHVSALDPFALGNMFRLTPAEARVAAGLAEGASAEQLAQTHRVAVSTVRTQIAQVIAKLGATRSVDVVRILRQGEALWSRAGRTGHALAD